MFNSKIDFDAVTDSEFSDLPAGTYPALVDEIKRIRWVNKEPQDLTGSTLPETEEDSLSVKYQIIGDSYAGKIQFDNLGMWKDSTRQFACARFKQLCVACDKDPNTVKAYHELYNIPVMIAITHSKNTNANGKPFVNVNKISKMQDIPFNEKATQGVTTDNPF